MSTVVHCTADHLVSIYGDVLDGDTIGQIHGECRGVRSDCYEQLTALTGVAAPSVGADDGGGMEVMLTGDSDAPYQCDGWSYDEAVATGEEKATLERRSELSELYKRKVEDVGQLAALDRQFDAAAAFQRQLGAQSTRRNNFNLPSSLSLHARGCFQEMLEREKEHCGEYVCFYHSYSFVALLYEVQACIARTLYGLPETLAPMARLLKRPFKGKPHVRVLLKEFTNMGKQDHHPDFREVAISCSVSLLSPRSEAPPVNVFEGGYSQTDLSFRNVLEKLFSELGVRSASEITKLCDKVVAVGEQYNLASSFRSQGSDLAADGKSGQMLQIFVRVDCVDDVAYGSQPMGVYCAEWNPCSRYLTADTAPEGQARVFWHPGLFLDPTKCKVYHYAAKVNQMGKARLQLQRHLLQALEPLLGTPEKALRAYMGIEGLL